MAWFWRKKKEPPSGTQELRLRALTAALEEVEAHPRAEGRILVGLMDMRIDKGAVTLAVYADGTTSVYTDAGGGIIGAGEHERVRAASQAFLAEAEYLVDRMAPATDFSLPRAGHIRFFLRTVEGVQAADVAESILRRQEPHELLPLFGAGQAVVTQVRLLAPTPGERSEAPHEDDRPGAKLPAAQRLLGAIAEFDGAELARLLSDGADPNATNADSVPLLMVAASRRWVTGVSILLRHGADPNARTTDPTSTLPQAPTLLQPAITGTAPIVRLLLDAGADVDAADATGTTALMSAAYEGHGDVVRLLIDRGAKLEARDANGYTALMWASNGGHAGIVEDLLRAAADPDARARDGSTPLMFAAQHGHGDAVRALLTAGADATARGTHGLTALGLALQNKQPKTANLLRDAGGT